MYETHNDQKWEDRLHQSSTVFDWSLLMDGTSYFIFIFSLSCRVFDTGMECARNWSKTCLKKQDQEKVTSSVVGALETYRFLCSDKKFQKDFLQHGDCYKRISPQWDECARKFIESLKRVDHSKDTLGLCW